MPIRVTSKRVKQIAMTSNVIHFGTAQSKLAAAQDQRLHARLETDDRLSCW
jgi:hypothetical protein